MKHIGIILLAILTLFGVSLVSAPTAQASHLQTTVYNGDGYNTGWGIGVNVNCNTGYSYDYIVPRGGRSGYVDCIYVGAGACLYLQRWNGSQNVPYATTGRGPYLFYINVAGASLTASARAC